MCWKEDSRGLAWCWQCWCSRDHQQVCARVSADVAMTFVTPTSHYFWVCVSSPAANSLCYWWTDLMGVLMICLKQFLISLGLETIHTRRCIQGSALSAQAQSSKCAVGFFFCGYDYRLWKLTRCQPSTWSASLHFLSITWHTGLHSSWISIRIISLWPQTWYLLIWSSCSFYINPGKGGHKNFLHPESLTAKLQLQALSAIGHIIILIIAYIIAYMH